MDTVAQTKSVYPAHFAPAFVGPLRMHDDIDVEVIPTPALAVGDEFMPSGDYAQDVADLRAIYALSEAELSIEWFSTIVPILAPRVEAVFARLSCVDTDGFPLARFLEDCRRSFEAHQALWAGSPDPAPGGVDAAAGESTLLTRKSDALI